MTRRFAEIIKNSITEEDKVIGNLKRRFNSPSLRGQRQIQISPALVTGNIALSYYRGLQVGRDEREKEIIRELKKKFPKAAQSITEQQTKIKK